MLTIAVKSPITILESIDRAQVRRRPRLPGSNDSDAAEALRRLGEEKEAAPFTSANSTEAMLVEEDLMGTGAGEDSGLMDATDQAGRDMYNTRV